MDYPKNFISFLSMQCAKFGLDLPIVVNKREIKNIMNFFSQCLSSLGPPRHIVMAGMNDSKEYVSTGWLVNSDGIFTHGEAFVSSGEAILPDIHVFENYLEQSEKEVKKICLNKVNLRFFNCFFNFVKKKISNGTSCLIVPDQQIEKVSQILSLPISDRPVDEGIIQCCRKDFEDASQCKKAFLILPQSGTTRVKNTYLFTGEICCEAKPSVSLLPYLIHVSLLKEIPAFFRNEMSAQDKSPVIVDLLKRYMEEPEVRKISDRRSVNGSIVIPTKHCTQWMKQIDPSITSKNIKDSLQDCNIRFLDGVKKGQHRISHIEIFDKLI